jgi:ribosomal protein L37AE/L43A
MRKGTHHSAETRLAIRLKRLEKSMPPEEFARFMAAAGALKWCPKCEQLLPVGEFQNNKRAYDGLYDRCAKCNAKVAGVWYDERSQDEQWRERKNQRQVARRAASKGTEQTVRADKKYSLKHLYGITLEQFEAMLAAQRNRCAICERRFAGGRDTHVDHDHVTGIVRGLLCTNCNNGLGRFRDDPATLRRAARYVERARGAPLASEDRGQGVLWDGDAAEHCLLACGGSDVDRARTVLRAP